MNAMTHSGKREVRGLRPAVFLAAGALLFAFRPAVRAADRVPASNVDRLAEAADSAAASFCRRFGLVRGDTLRLSFRPDSADSRGRFVLARWILGLDRRDIRVTDPAETSDGWCVVPAAAEVGYAPAGRRSFLRSGSVRRTARVALIAVRPARDGSPRADTLSAACTDTVPRPALDAVEQGGLLLGRPVRPSGGARIRFLETAAAAVVAGWSAYAFFSIRSH
jgi:hypothetical protein